MSSPLVLGLDLRQTAAVAHVWPIIANKEAIAINQAYAGHPGWLAKQWDPRSIPRARVDRDMYRHGLVNRSAATNGSTVYVNRSWRDPGAVSLAPCSLIIGWTVPEREILFAKTLRNV